MSYHSSSVRNVAGSYQHTCLGLEFDCLSVTEGDGEIQQQECVFVFWCVQWIFLRIFNLNYSANLQGRIMHRARNVLSWVYMLNQQVEQKK